MDGVKIKTFVVQLFQRSDSSESMISALRHFMFDDQRNPLYVHVYENTLFIYSAFDFWNINSLSMMIRSHLLGDYFVIYEIDEYDGLLPTAVWEKKKDAVTYFTNKEEVLNKYKRKYTIEKIKKRSFRVEMGNDEPTLESVDEEIVKEKITKKNTKQTKQTTVK